MDTDEEFASFVARTAGDASVLGIVLTGSRAREGVAARHSDHDVLLVVADGAAAEISAQIAAETRRDARMDVWAMTIADFRTHALPGSGTEWNRYAFSHARVLHDTPERTIQALVTAKGTTTPEESREAAAGALDAFLNSLYRAAKNARDGNALGARLDAAEAVPSLLAHLFAADGRLRPYNKYLEWELRRQPLRAAGWSYDHLAASLERILSADGLGELRRVLARLEPQARAAGHGAVLDGWGDDLVLMRGHGT